MQKIKREIAKIIFSGGTLQTSGRNKKINELVNLFKSYARSLVPDMQHYDNDDVKIPTFNLGLFVHIKMVTMRVEKKY